MCSTELEDPVAKAAALLRRDNFAGLNGTSKVKTFFCSTAASMCQTQQTYSEGLLLSIMTPSLQVTQGDGRLSN
jgi:hypothetical protein